MKDAQIHKLYRQERHIYSELLEVRTSRKKGGGLGLFALKDMPGILLAYFGNKMTERELHNTYPDDDAPNVLESNGVFIDPHPTHRCLASYANHSKVGNASFVDGDEGGFPFLEVDAITKGEEVVVDYGPCYAYNRYNFTR